MPRCMVLVQPNKFAIQSRESVALQPQEARVRVRKAGICGTDLAIASGAYPVPLPLVLGHEWIGEVVELGPGADATLLDERVVGEINNTCALIGAEPVCEACARGIPSHCLRRTVTGIVGHDGAFQEELVVPAGVLRRVPTRIADDEAVWVEPLAAALQTFEITPIPRGGLVVVLGAGRLGVLIALVAKALGASVIAVTRTGTRDDLLRSLGIESFTFDAGQRPAAPGPLDPARTPLLEHVLGRTKGLGAEIVVDATGKPESVALALDLVRPRGVVALKSTSGRPIDGFALTRFVVNEVQLHGSRCGDFSAALRFLEAFQPPVRQLIRGEIDVADLEKGMVEAARTSGKILVRVAGGFPRL